MSRGCANQRRHAFLDTIVSIISPSKETAAHSAKVLSLINKVGRFRSVTAAAVPAKQDGTDFHAARPFTSSLACHDVGTVVVALRGVVFNGKNVEARGI